MIDVDQLPDLRPLVDPLLLERVGEQVAEEMRRNRKKDSAIEAPIYLRRFLPLKEVLAISKRIGERLKSNTL